MKVFFKHKAPFRKKNSKNKFDCRFIKNVGVLIYQQMYKFIFLLENVGI